MTTIPTPETCRKLTQEMGMMPHIVDHSVMVRDVSLFLCDLLKPTHPNLNCGLVGAAAMLHDITKTRSFSTGEKHSESGAELLNDLGYHAIGDIVRQHVVLDSYSETGPVTAEEIVNYSDKRVLHARVVALERRLDYIVETYGTTPESHERLLILWEKTVMIETKIFRGLAVSPTILESLNTN